MYCTACGVKNSPESNYCKQCGHKIDRPIPVKISEEAFDRALPEEEQVSALLERAYRLRADGDIEGAIALCHEALALKAGSTSAHSLLGQLYAQQGEREKAVQEYERVLQLNPGSIADRVKLDELRASEDTETPALTGRPRIVLTEQKFTPESARNGLAIAACAVILMLTGGAFALKFWPQSPAPSSSSSKENGFASADVTQPPAFQQTDTTQRHQEIASGAASAPNTGERAAVQTPVGTGTGNLFSQPSPATAPHRQNSAPVQMASSVPPPSGNTGTAPGLTIKEVPDSPAKSRLQPKADNSRVLLSGDDSVTEDGDGNYTIRVKTGSGASRVTGGGNNAENGSGGTGAIIRVSDGNSGTTTTASDIGNPPRHEASAAIAMGNDLKDKKDYNRAIAAYQKALSGAGDETASVYQAIAICFQAKGDRDSAIKNYERAISEWERLISESRKADIARSAIRVCKNGILICRSE